jgi:hypothetical protein
VPITFPIPGTLHHNPFVNEVMRRMMQYRWERVEFEARQIERGKWKEPQHTPFIPVDDEGNRIENIDLPALARAKKAEVRAQQARVQVPDVPASYCVGSSLADRVRVLTDEEWARL